MTEESASSEGSITTPPVRTKGCQHSFNLGCLFFLGIAALYAIERAVYYYDPPEVTRLIQAIAGDDEMQVREILDAGADLNRVTRDVWYYFGIPNTTEWSPMHAAAASSNPRMVRILLDAGGDLGLRARGGRAPLGIAVSYGQFETALVILESMESFPGAPEIVETAKAHGGATIHSPMGQTMDKILGSWLRDRRGEPTPPLISACRTPGSADRIRALIEADAEVEEVDVFGWTPLIWASGVYGDLESVVSLLQAGADPNQESPEGWTPLHAAAQAAADQRVERLLEHGADPNLQEDIGLYSPLFFAAKSGSAKIARALIEAGAETRVQDRFGRFPLESWSIRDPSERKEFVKLMTEHGRLKLLDVSEIELVTDEKITEELCQRMSVRAAEGILEDGKLRVRARVHFSNPPVDLAFDSFWIAGDDEFPGGTFCGEMAHVEGRSVEAVVPQGTSVIRCVLRPNAELGRECHVSGRIFGAEMSFPPVSIQIVEEFSTWNRR